MHLVVRDVVGAYRLKRACTHMQSDIGNMDARVLQICQHFCIEMQAGGRRGHGARPFCIHCLIALLIVETGIVMYIGWQGQATVTIQ